MIRNTILAALLVLSLVAVTGLVAGQEDVVTIDADHAIDSSAAVQEYEEAGIVSRNLTRIDMEVTVSKSNQEAGIDGWHTNFNHDFVCVDYRENIQRTVRIFIADDYLQPRIASGLDSETSDTEAKLEPTNENNHTAMTMTFDGRERACYKLSKEAGIYFGAKRSAYTIANQSIDWEIPRLAGSKKQWQYVDNAEFAVNSTVAIDARNESLTLQYDSDPDPAVETWLTVPECDDPSEQPVCQYTQDGDPGTVYLLTTQEEPPAVRYKVGRDPWADIKSYGEDLSQIPGRAQETVNGILGGGSDGD